MNRRRGWIGTPQYEVMVMILVEAREIAGITQQTLASRLGVQQSMVAKIESRQRNVSLLEFLAIAKALGAAPDELVQRIERAMRTVSV